MFQVQILYSTLNICIYSVHVYCNRNDISVFDRNTVYTHVCPGDRTEVISVATVRPP